MNKVYRIITEQILEQLRAGTVPWRREFPRGSRLGPRNLISDRPYRGVNTILLLNAQLMEGWETPVWMTYRQAARVGGNVRRGEHSVPVVFWKIHEKRRAEEEGDDAGVERKRFPVLRYYRVFNADQCALPSRVEEGLARFRVARANLDPIASAERIVAQMPERPEITNRTGSAHYRPETDTVCVPPIGVMGSAESYYGTLFHELVHSTAHPSRLGRTLSWTRGDREYALEELTAELGACFLRVEAGIPSSPAMENSAAYISQWLRRLDDDPKLVIHAAARAQRAVDFILGRRTGATAISREQTAAVTG